MALLQCEMCCGDLDISPDRSIGVCKYCGSTFTIPREMEKRGNLFNRANYLRQTCNFDKAIGVYESILAEDCEDADALWGMVLCRYGIEFVEDPGTGSRIPTCHRTSRTSILLDPDYKSALRFADEEKRAVYEENATRIDQIQKSILSLSFNQEKYDAFICYKETDAEGERTLDSVLAQELYNELQRLHIKTFFSRKTLENRIGSEYEPIIYSALTSAKVMVVLATKPEHFEATWVKNEWSRYLDFMKEDSEKHLIPVYRDMSAYQLPEEFMSIQAVDMNKLGYLQDLTDGIKKLLHKDEHAEAAAAASPVSKESLYSRAMVFLGNREFYKAVDYFEKVLDIAPQYARAYWGSLLASYQCVTNQELVNCAADDWTEDPRLANAMEFASDEEKRLYEDTLKRRVEKFKGLAVAALEAKDFEKCLLWCDKCLKRNPESGELWWLKLLASEGTCNSMELSAACLRKSVTVLEREEYQKAVRYSIEEEALMYEKVGQRIEETVREKRRADAYSDCKRYMENALHTQSKRAGTIGSRHWRDMEQEAEMLRYLRLSRCKFFHNNVFSLLMQAVLWGIGVYTGLLLLQMADYHIENMGTSFAVILGLFAAVMAIVQLAQFSSHRKKLPILVDNYEIASRSLAANRQLLTEATEQQHQMQALYDVFSTKPEMELPEIITYRDRFSALQGSEPKTKE
ncbi:MAG: TIR domain-containing protein [Ruminococcaceae bacterium]|nr:TIR domain-containing protein [Oscillospiraceae bacterium]